MEGYEEIGYEEIGADESVEELLGIGYDEIGARRPARRPGVRPPNVTSKMGSEADAWIGFPATLVATLATANIPTAPQLLFKPFRLFIPSDIAGNFTVDQLMVGADNCWGAGATPVPARAFQENATPSSLRTMTAQPNSNITITVTNFSAAGSTMRAALLGKAIRRG